MVSNLQPVIINGSLKRCDKSSNISLKIFDVLSKLGHRNNADLSDVISGSHFDLSNYTLIFLLYSFLVKVVNGRNVKFVLLKKVKCENPE